MNKQLINQQITFATITTLIKAIVLGTLKYSLLGVELELTPNNYTIEDAFEDLESTLQQINKKVIVVVDDLDRLTYSAIKDVLFTIKKSFTLPNVSYVLCYDTDNIVEQEKQDKDAEKVIEFLEKFVNVKFSLFLHTHTLYQYISDNFEKAVRNNLLFDPYTLDQMKLQHDIAKAK